MEIAYVLQGASRVQIPPSPLGRSPAAAETALSAAAHPHPAESREEGGPRGKHGFPREASDPPPAGHVALRRGRDLNPRDA